MKNYRFIAILLVLCMLATLTACQSASNRPTDTSSTTTIPATTTTAPPLTTTAPKLTDCKLFAYETGIDTSAITEDSFVQLYQHAEYIMQNYETVSYTKDLKFRQALLECWLGRLKRGEEIEETSERYILHIDKVKAEDRETARFLIVIALLIKEYQANCCYFNFEFFASTEAMSVTLPAVFVVTTDHDNYKDGWMKDYIFDIRGDASIAGDETFVIDPGLYRYGLISNFKDYLNNYMDPPNLRDEIIAKAFPDE